MSDPFDLARFVEAQCGSYEQALQELTTGRKRSHWMWYVFPQIAGLGSSAMAQRYAIGSLDEARAYLRHPVLGNRLRTCTAAVNRVADRTAYEIFGTPDDAKFRSSMTLFALADAKIPSFASPLPGILRVRKILEPAPSLAFRKVISVRYHLQRAFYGLWHAGTFK